MTAATLAHPLRHLVERRRREDGKASAPLAPARSSPAKPRPVTSERGEGRWFAGLLVVMLGYLAWLFSLWVSFLGGLALVGEIFGVAAGGALVLLAAYAYRGRRRGEHRRPSAADTRVRPSRLRVQARGAPPELRRGYERRGAR